MIPGKQAFPYVVLRFQKFGVFEVKFILTRGQRLARQAVCSICCAEYAVSIRCRKPSLLHFEFDLVLLVEKYATP